MNSVAAIALLSPTNPAMIVTLLAATALEAPRCSAPTRRALLSAATAALSAPQLLSVAPALAATTKATDSAVATARGFLDLRIIQRFDVEVLEDAAVRGRLEFEIFGDDAPAAAANFLSFVRGDIGQFAKTPGEGPSYRQGAFTTLEPGVLLQGGRINGLKLGEFGGEPVWEFGTRPVPVKAVVEANDLSHDRRGLLTRKQFQAGPEFGITLGPASSLNGGWEVFGRVSSDESGLLKLMEGLPYITGRSLEEPGSVSDGIFNAQKGLFGGLAKGMGDARAEDRTGRLLRRVEMVNCGLL